MKAGFIGLGLMGSRMAANILEGGYELIIYNRTASKAEPLVKKGAELAQTAYQAAAGADVLFTMLSTPDSIKALALEPDGFLQGLQKNAIWIDCSTVNPSFTRWIAKTAAEKGIRFIDAPVSGTTIPAEKGELTFFAGGNKNDIDEVMPLLNLMGKKIIYAGNTGMGTSFKMVVNLMLAAAMESFSEALTLGEALGLTREQLFEVLIGGPVTAPMIAGKKNKITTNEYSADFPLKWMHKDLQLVTDTAYENMVPLPVTHIIKEVFSLADKKGLGDFDFSAIYKFFSE